MNVHTGAANREAGANEIDMQTLKKYFRLFLTRPRRYFRYIQYCRSTCGPRLNGEATKKLQNQVNRFIFLKANCIQVRSYAPDHDRR